MREERGCRTRSMRREHWHIGIVVCRSTTARVDGTCAVVLPTVEVVRGVALGAGDAGAMVFGAADKARSGQLCRGESIGNVPRG